MKDEEKGAISSEEKEVEELARAMCSFSKNTLCRECSDACFYKDYAKRAIDKGWRKQEWISVEERLPDEQGRFLIVDKEGQMNTAFYTPRFGWFSHFRIKNITHWMPLPEAPKGGAE